MKKEHWIILSGLVIGGLIYFNRKKPKVQIAEFPININSGNGYKVKVLQTYLNTSCKANLEVNGIFDKRVEEISVKCIGTPNTPYIDEKAYNRIFRDLKTANLLPKR
jgi:hypothetical protein